ncbi:UNVERIFIED_CONTAM: DUF3263 domain-containing protein [Kocuria sp. CPCC 205316]|uniref:DUF3263 domain-containing protein n=1 Tax=Kocuria TaxID=57493 RepID=UPI0036D85821
MPEDTVPADDTSPGEEPSPGEDTASRAEPAPDGGPAGEGAGLGAVDREILALENLQWKYQGAKEMEIRRRLNLSPTHYYQRLNVLIDTRAALEHDPMLVARLRRQRGDHG